MAAPRVARAPDPELALGPGAAPRYQRTRHLPGAKLEDLLVELFNNIWVLRTAVVLRLF